MSSKLIIKSHHPGKHRARIITVVAVLAIIGWAVFEYGHSRSGYDYDNLQQERDKLQNQLDSAQAKIQDQQERIAVLVRASQVDKKGYSGVEQTLKDLQDEMLELKQEVAFYRGIVSPTDTASGINVTDFSISHIGEGHAYRFKLVMTQTKNNTRLVRGYIRVAFEGVQDGAQVEKTLYQVSGGKLNKLKLRFKYFQNIEGEIVLPEGFLPSRVIVDVVSVGKDAIRLKKTFDWPDIIS
jgi:hypothetical protein